MNKRSTPYTVRQQRQRKVTFELSYPFVDTGLINCQEYPNDPKDVMKA